jgi:Putative glycosyl/glycerophosphate transferases involved in teichoic acid biosynthesis TagF/TagB/EpsJ/RodC
MQKRNWLIVLFWFMLILLEARPAYAYLDPGTGSALVCVLVSVVAAFTYVARSVVYAVKHRLRHSGGEAAVEENLHDEDGDIVLFSEGRDYWLTFKPVIEALIARDCRFRYLTMDVEDPALEIDDPRMDSRFIGNGYVAFGRVAAARGAVMLSTTPNIGCADFPIPKPSNIACLAHVMHGCCDVSYYHKHSLDYYDAVFLINPAMKRSIRHLEAIRSLPLKECVVAGTPNLDEICKTVRRREGQNAKPLILFAPTWGLKGFLRRYGTDFIKALAATGEYDLILRPHPQSWRKEPRFMNGVVRQLEKYPNVTVDKSLSPARTLSRADILVSDISGIRFEFAFLYKRPVITLKAEGDDDSMFEAADMEGSWETEAEKRIGAVVGPGEIGDMPAIVKKALAISTEKMAAFRDEYVAHLGFSSQVVADWLIAKRDEIKVDS